MITSNIPNADFEGIYSSRLNMVHIPVPVDKAKELTETYEAIQKQIEKLPTSEKKSKK